jgi:hypothetical protein
MEFRNDPVPEYSRERTYAKRHAGRTMDMLVAPVYPASQRENFTSPRLSAPVSNRCILYLSLCDWSGCREMLSQGGRLSAPTATCLVYGILPLCLLSPLEQGCQGWLSS